MQRWTPPVALSPQEKMLMKRLTRVRALFGFLRRHRHERSSVPEPLVLPWELKANLSAKSGVDTLLTNARNSGSRRC